MSGLLAAKDQFMGEDHSKVCWAGHEVVGININNTYMRDRTLMNSGWNRDRKLSWGPARIINLVMFTKIPLLMGLFVARSEVERLKEITHIYRVEDTRRDIFRKHDIKKVLGKGNLEEQDKGQHRK